jgi:DNA polymerase III epsilon subunit-like protein
VDIEASGPTPSDYAMLSIGAATVKEARQSFYIELKPSSMLESEGTSAIHGLSLEKLAKNGVEPKTALEQFEQWLLDVVKVDEEPVFVAFNAPFDWMFVNDYFHRYLGRNPFGHRALDIKALFMGMRAVEWADTSHQAISREYGLQDTLPHHAGEDAILEAEILAKILKELKAKNPEMLAGSLK